MVAEHPEPAQGQVLHLLQHCKVYLNLQLCLNKVSIGSIWEESPKIYSWCVEGVRRLFQESPNVEIYSWQHLPEDAALCLEP